MNSMCMPIQEFSSNPSPFDPYQNDTSRFLQNCNNPLGPWTTVPTQRIGDSPQSFNNYFGNPTNNASIICPRLKQYPSQSITSGDKITFHPDRFEVCVDIRGLNPPDIKIHVMKNQIEVVAQQQCPPIGTENCYTQKSLTMSRIFHLPQPVVPELAQCQFMNDSGSLVIAAPWGNH